MNRTKIQTLCEGAVCAALSLALSYLKIPVGLSFGGFGGSIDLVMLPLIVFAVRAGLGWGVGAGLVFGTMKYLFAEGTAVNWVSILFDYALAYGFVGFAGLWRGKYCALPLAALGGCAARFFVHFLSGVTVYAQYMPAEFLGLHMRNAAIYSLLYNGTYMLPNTVLAVALCFALRRAAGRIFPAQR